MEQHKYLKYKHKYINMKRQHGGGNDRFAIVSKGNTITNISRGFNDSFFRYIMKLPTKNDGIEIECTQTGWVYSSYKCKDRYSTEYYDYVNSYETKTSKVVEFYNDDVRTQLIEIIDMPRKSMSHHQRDDIDKLSDTGDKYNSFSITEKRNLIIDITNYITAPQHDFWNFFMRSDESIQYVNSGWYNNIYTDPTSGATYTNPVKKDHTTLTYTDNTNNKVTIVRFNIYATEPRSHTYWHSVA
jgi:hypothetical protein